MSHFSARDLKLSLDFMNARTTILVFENRHDFLLHKRELITKFDLIYQVDNLDEMIPNNVLVDKVIFIMIDKSTFNILAMERRMSDSHSDFVLECVDYQKNMQEADEKIEKQDKEIAELREELRRKIQSVTDLKRSKNRLYDILKDKDMKIHRLSEAFWKQRRRRFEKVIKPLSYKEMHESFKLTDENNIHISVEEAEDVKPHEIGSIGNILDSFDNIVNGKVETTSYDMSENEFEKIINNI